MTHVVLTGASRGIGRATAHALARRGCSLSLIGRDSTRFAATVEALERQGTPPQPYYCNLACSDEVVAVGERVVRDHGAPDVLINNAGIAKRASVVEQTPEVFDEHFAVNLRAPFLLTRAFLPGMVARGSGRVLQVGSISATIGSANQTAYNSSKWALVGFTKSLAEELRDTGVMTVVVHPGSVDTEMLAGSGFVPRMTPAQVADTLVHYALDAPLAHNGGVIEMFGV